MLTRQGAHRRAFALVEAVQGEDHVAAAQAVDAAETEAGEWPEVLFVLAVARAVYAVVRPGNDDPAKLVEALLDEAQEPAARAIALGLGALLAAGSGDTAELLSSACRAIALLDDTSLPGMERCLALVICAAALNTLRLWELVDELYAAALVDHESAVAAGQYAAVATNRVLIGLEHGLALLEYGDRVAARARLADTAVAVTAALEQDLRPLWRHDVEAVGDLVRLLDGTPPLCPVADHLQALQDEGDVEVLPLLQATAALVAWETAAKPGPAADLPVVMSASSGARSFPLWVRAEVLATHEPSAAASAQQEHARLSSRLLWESRAAVLSAARAQLTSERQRVEHDRLSVVAHMDALTGLHNRRRFDDWLQRPSAGGPAALLLLDLDDFKAVNDRFGHACGDEVLRRVGLFLRAAVRPGDLAVRQGGDEFALVLQDGSLDDDAVLARARDVADAVSGEDWGAIAPALTVALSVGAALIVATPGEVVGNDLYARADRALYQAKREGRSPVLAGPRSTPRDR